ncbi:conserved hypothetical protein [groundwater metagenome]|uniref:AFP-like domain-containing protein n=1 Tax=groundwater metagenome TaxID=717931 RepID=A0A098EA68_9ZZZZ
MKVQNKFIGEEVSVFIIAEVGVNHNGDINLAKKLIDAAKDADCDAVKFQTFKAENVVTENAERAGYQVKNIGGDETQRDMLKKYELRYDNFIELKKYCDEKGIIFLSTPHSEDAIDFLENLVPAYKFGSGDLTNIPALEYAAKKRKPMIIGTGMATMDEVKEALNAIYAQGNEEVVMLHCTTNYPCALEEVNLRAMQTMQKQLNCLVGYSDHTNGIIVPVMAVAMGACVIEKHFTHDKNLSGPDHKASLEPDELKEMVNAIRDAEKALGSGIKAPAESEKEIMKVARKSIIAKVDIPKDTIITKGMLSIKRPGNGVAPKYLKEIIGKKAKVDIRSDELIKFEYFE